jgi:hypothetical protein
MKRLLIQLFSFVVFTLFLYSCSCKSCENEDAIIPFSILSKADKFIADQTGLTFFKNYIKPDFNRSRKLENGYLLVYNFFIPEKPFVKGDIRFTVDTLGNVKKDMEIFGIPLCTDFPEDCMFVIDESKAKKIARENGLEEGIKEWKSGLIYDSLLKKYIWHILSTSNESEGEFGYRANGTEFLICPNTGKVLQKNKWKIN